MMERNNTFTEKRTPLRHFKGVHTEQCSHRTHEEIQLPTRIQDI